MLQDWEHYPEDFEDYIQKGINDITLKSPIWANQTIDPIDFPIVMTKVKYHYEYT